MVEIRLANGVRETFEIFVTRAAGWDIPTVVRDHCPERNRWTGQMVPPNGRFNSAPRLSVRAR